MFKPLYNWIYSIQKTSYDLKFLENRLDGPIIYSGIPYKNLIDLYNDYYRKYKLISHLPNVVVVDYFKIISSDGFNYLNTKLSKIGIQCKNPSFYSKKLNEPSKNHGKPVKNSKEALLRAKKVEEDYRQYVQQRSDLVSSLDQNLYDYLNCILMY
jgi:hypothetical protein